MPSSAQYSRAAHHSRISSSSPPTKKMQRSVAHAALDARARRGVLGGGGHFCSSHSPASFSRKGWSGHTPPKTGARWTGRAGKTTAHSTPARLWIAATKSERAARKWVAVFVAPWYAFLKSLRPQTTTTTSIGWPSAPPPRLRRDARRQPRCGVSNVHRRRRAPSTDVVFVCRLTNSATARGSASPSPRPGLQPPSRRVADEEDRPARPPSRRRRRAVPGGAGAGLARAGGGGVGRRALLLRRRCVRPAPRRSAGRAPPAADGTAAGGRACAPAARERAGAGRTA